MIGAFMLVPAHARASETDRAATRAYIHADYRLMQAATSQIPRIGATLRGLVSQVRQECPMAAVGFPQNAELMQIEDEIIGAIVTTVVDLGRTTGRAFVSVAERLTWSDRKLTRRVHRYVDSIRTLLALPPPTLCADVKSWAASGFTQLAADTLTFTPRFMAAWVALGELPPALARYETPDERPLVARTERLEARFEDFEAREVKTGTAIMAELGLGNGLP